MNAPPGLPGLVRLLLRLFPGDFRRRFAAEIEDALGVFVAFLGVDALHAWLYGVPSTDPVSFAAVPLSFVVAALAAMWVTVRPALSVRPVVVLGDA